MNEEPVNRPVGETVDSSDSTEPTQMTPLTRAISVFHSPGETFEDIGRKPTWVVPVIIAIVFAFGSGYLFREKVFTPEVFDRTLREQLAQTLEKQGQEVNEEMMQQQFRFARLPYQYWYVTSIISTLFMVLIVAGAYFVILLLMQAEVKFKKVFSVVCWSWMARSVVAGLLGITTLLLRDPATIDPMRPERLLATNLSILLSPREGSTFLYSLAGSFDVIEFWYLFLLSVGFSKIGRRLTIGKSAGVVLTLWALYVLGKAGLSSLF